MTSEAQTTADKLVSETLAYKPGEKKEKVLYESCRAEAAGQSGPELRTDSEPRSEFGNVRDSSQPSTETKMAEIITNPGLPGADLSLVGTFPTAAVMAQAPTQPRHRANRLLSGPVEISFYILSRWDGQPYVLGGSH